MFMDMLIKQYNYKDTIHNPKDVLRFCRDLKGLCKEVFLVIFLDSNNGVIAKEIVSIGILNASIIHPREVFRTAIVNNAASVIIVHNHPSGNLSPSDDDIETTKKLRQAGAIIGIKLLDHIIVSEDIRDYQSI